MDYQGTDIQRIARLAHALWQERGRPLGSPEDDWYRAEQILGVGPAGAFPESNLPLPSDLPLPTEWSPPAGWTLPSDWALPLFDFGSDAR